MPHLTGIACATWSRRRSWRRGSCSRCTCTTTFCRVYRPLSSAARHTCSSQTLAGPIHLHTVRPAGIKKNFKKFWYHGIVYLYFAYNSDGKLKSYNDSLLRYGNSDQHFLGTLKNTLQICQKYDPAHHDFVAWDHFRCAKSWKPPKICQNTASSMSTKIWPILWVLHLMASLKWPQAIKSWCEGSYFWQICNVFFRVPKKWWIWFPYPRRLTWYDFNFPSELLTK